MAVFPTPPCPASACHVLQGFLYVLDCYGATRKGFPLQMGDIQVGPGPGQRDRVWRRHPC